MASLLALDVLVALCGTLAGLSFNSLGLAAAAVLSMADLLSSGRPRKVGLGDDYASLIMAVFVVWAGVLLITQGISGAAPTVVSPLAALVCLAVFLLKFALYRTVPRAGTDWFTGHLWSDTCVFGAVSLIYIVELLSGQRLESAMVMVIGVLVIWTALELAAEAIIEIITTLRR